MASRIASATTSGVCDPPGPSKNAAPDLSAGKHTRTASMSRSGGRTASLYVNDFNAPALATYRRCGYTERGVFSTVLY